MTGFFYGLMKVMKKDGYLTKGVFVAGILSVVVLIGGYIYSEMINRRDLDISDFEECAAAGYPIMESYPGQCRTKSGRLFVQDIGNELDLAEQIILNNPRPNQLVQSPLVFDGKAVGPWFFEGSFSVDLVDSEGALISRVVLTADEDWMTTNFVPFSGKMIFDKHATKKGRLQFLKANPSGDPERDVTLIVPIRFE